MIWQTRTKWLVWCIRMKIGGEAESKLIGFGFSLRSMRIWVKKITAMAEGKKVWDKHGESMEHGKTGQKRQSVSMYSSDAFKCPNAVWLHLAYSCNWTCQKIQRSSEDMMIHMWLFSGNGFLMFCSRSQIIAAAEIQPLFKWPNVLTFRLQISPARMNAISLSLFNSTVPRYWRNYKPWLKILCLPFCNF